MHTLKITAIVGSLRSKSVNGAVARAAIEVGSTHAEIELFSVADVPLYNGDIEQVALPAAVQALHDSVGAADGVLLFSPEYNGSFPAVTKNAIDWLSRPPRELGGHPHLHGGHHAGCSRGCEPENPLRGNHGFPASAALPLAWYRYVRREDYRR